MRSFALPWCGTELLFSACISHLAPKQFAAGCSWLCPGDLGWAASFTHNNGDMSIPQMGDPAVKLKGN